jgi:hypothetical protein
MTQKLTSDKEQCKNKTSISRLLMKLKKIQLFCFFRVKMIR